MPVSVDRRVISRSEIIESTNEAIKTAKASRWVLSV
jgi:hypothetical protein